MSVSVHYGLGRRNVTPEESAAAIKWLWIAFQVTPSAEITAKISISLMLIRITTNRKWKIFLYTLIATGVMVTIMLMFAILLSCRPLVALWDASVKGTCTPHERAIAIYFQGGESSSAVQVMDRSMASQSMASDGSLVSASTYDVILATSPTFMLKGIHIDIFKKALICGLLALGAL